MIVRHILKLQKYDSKGSQEDILPLIFSGILIRFKKNIKHTSMLIHKDDTKASSNFVHLAHCYSSSDKRKSKFLGSCYESRII